MLACMIKSGLCFAMELAEASRKIPLSFQLKICNLLQSDGFHGSCCTFQFCCSQTAPMSHATHSNFAAISILQASNWLQSDDSIVSPESFWFQGADFFVTRFARARLILYES